MLDSAYAIVKAGLRPVFIEYIMAGKNTAQIVTSLRDEHRIEVTEGAVRQFQELTGDASRAIAVSMQKDLAQHHRDAMIHYQDFWDSYREAFALPDTDLMKVEKMKLFAGEMRQWWLNIGRHLRLQDLEAPKTDVQLLKQTNIIQIIADEAKAGKLGVEAFERLLARTAEQGL